VICRKALALVLALAGLRAGAAEPAAAPANQTLRADEAEFNPDTGENTGRGHAQWTGRWKGKDVLLTADEIRYIRRTETLVATCTVTLTNGDERLLADRVEYNRLTGRFSALNLRIGRYPIYVQGASAEGTLEEITIHRAVISYTEPGRWKPSA